MTVFHNLAKETLIYGLSYSLGRVINFLLVTSYLTYRVFTQTDGFFSIYQDLYFYIGLLLGALSLRMETAFFRYSSDSDSRSDVYPLMNQMIWLVCGIFAAIVYFFQTEILAFLKYDKSLTPHLWLAVWILITDVIIAIPFARIRFEKKPLRYAWIKLSGLVLNIFCVIFIFEGFHFFNENWVVNAMSSEDKLLYVLIANAVGSSISLLFLNKEILLAFQKSDWSPVFKILRYSIPLIIITFCFTIIQSGYTSYLKYLLSEDASENLKMTDALNAAFRLAVIMNLFLTAFNYAAEPFFFRHGKNKNAHFHFASVSKIFIYCCCMIFLFTSLNIDLFSFLLGERFRSAMHLVPILLLANIFSGLYSNLSVWNKLTDRNHHAAIISIIGLILNTGLYFVLVPILGVQSAAWIMLIVYMIMCLLSYIQGQKHYPIPYPIAEMFLVMGFSVFIVYFSLFIEMDNQILQIIVQNIIFLLTSIWMIRRVLQVVRKETTSDKI